MGDAARPACPESARRDTDIASAAAVRRWPVLLLVALAARALTFGNPLVHADEQFYFVVAKAMWHGQLPYLDIWDRKPVGLFLLYMPAALLPLPWGTLAYQAMALACVVATAALVARFAERAGWGRGAMAGGVAYILWLDLLNGSSGQSPVFYNLPVACAAWLTATRPGRRGAGLAAMALLGVALQIKPAAIFEGAFLGLWLLRDEWRARHDRPALVAYAAALGAMALLPTALSCGFYTARGAGAAWWQANIASVLGRLPDPPLLRLRNGLRLLLLLSPLIAMGFGFQDRPIISSTSAAPRLRRFLRLWFAVALSGIVLFGGWYDHYGLPAALPGAICAAAFLDWPEHRFAAPILLLAALAGQITLGVNRWKHGDGRDLAALVRAVGPGPRSLYVYSGETLLYPETGRPFVSRWVFPNHLYQDREVGSIGVDQATELSRIMSHRPDVVVVALRAHSKEPPVFARVGLVLARDYRPPTRVAVGTGWAAVYHRR